MLALHFLQEKYVRSNQLQALAQLADDHAAVELGEALVDVVGRNVQLHGGLFIQKRSETPVHHSSRAEFGKKRLFG
jgi:hypothetical protein